MHYEALLLRLTNSCEPWWRSGLGLLLREGRGKDTLRATREISCFCLKSPGKGKCPFQGDHSRTSPGRAGRLSPHRPCTGRKSCTQKHIPADPCLWSVGSPTTCESKTHQTSGNPHGQSKATALWEKLAWRLVTPHASHAE